MMRLAARLFFIGLLLPASADSASAQNIDQIIRDIGRLGQPRRATIQAEWERISPGEILCVDNRLRRNRRSVNALIDRGVGPSDNRVAGIVSECRADADAQIDTATPSFNCRAATYADEKAICATPELARLDRAVVEAYAQVLGREGARHAKSISDPLLRQRHDCGPDVDCIKRVQLSAIAAFQARGAAVQVPAPAQVTERGGGNATYTVNGMQLGSNFAASADSRDFSCAPSPQYDGFTECRRQTAERSRRRRVSESASVLHSADGSAAYINQSFEPVAMGDEDADDEVARLSETYGKASLLPLTDARGQRSGVIAAWGAVSLIPLEPERRAALASGADDQPGILVDYIGNVQRSAQQGLPIYRVSGGTGYIWSASWNGRGRGTLRMTAVDASRLPGAADVAKPAPAPVATPPAAENSAATAPVAEAPRLTEAAAPPAPKPAEPAVVQPPAKAAPPSNVRVVGPPIELRPAAAETAAPTTNSSGSNRLVIFLLALVAVLLGAVGYLYRKSRIAAAGLAMTAPAVPAAADVATPASTATPAAAAAPIATTMLEAASVPDTAAKPDVVAGPQSKMNLTALVPAESPDSMTGSAPNIFVPQQAAMTPGAGDGTERDASKPAVITSKDK